MAAVHAARRFRLTDRGLIRPGYVADIAVFDPATVADRSTYDDGTALATGVTDVIVNGEIVLRDGERTPALPGRGLRRTEVRRQDSPQSHREHREKTQTKRE